MCVIDFISRFGKVPDEGSNVYLIDVSLSSKDKNGGDIIWYY